MGGRVWGKCIREEGMMENENGGGICILEFEKYYQTENRNLVMSIANIIYLFPLYMY